MFPTVREVLALDPVRHGAPHVVAGERGLDRRVRWVHSAEVPDIAELLRGGELVLITGIGMPADDAGLGAFVDTLADVGVAGLVVELGRRYADRVPRAMATTAERRGMPLVELRRPTPFVRITEAVHALIVDAQLAELRATEEIHQRFTELSVQGAGPAEIVRQTAMLAGCPVVLENLSRQVLAFDPAGERAELLLDAWDAHSRRITPAGRTGFDAHTGWLVTTVGARGHDWGRLLVRTGDEPATRLVILAERAAATLALDRLVRRDQEGLARQIHRTLLTALLDGARPATEVALRARALGVPLERRRLVGAVVRFRDEDRSGSVDAHAARLRDLAETVAQALRDARLDGLAGAIDEHAVGALLALPADPRRPNAATRPDPGRSGATARPDPGRSGTAPRGESGRSGAVDPSRAGDVPVDVGRALDAFADAVHRLCRVPGGLVIGAGDPVEEIRDARRSLVEAGQVAEAARTDTRGVPYYRLPDVGLRGLLHLLRDDARLQTFVERELGPLLAYQTAHPKENLLGALRAYLASGRNKSVAAAAAHLSRPAFYERLERIGRVLGADLDAVDVAVSLHVALLAHDVLTEN